MSSRESWVVNPKTHRPILVRSTTYQKLVQRNRYSSNRLVSITRSSNGAADHRDRWVLHARTGRPVLEHRRRATLSSRRRSGGRSARTRTTRNAPIDDRSYSYSSSSASDYSNSSYGKRVAGSAVPLLPPRTPPSLPPLPPTAIKRYCQNPDRPNEQGVDREIEVLQDLEQMLLDLTRRVRVVARDHCQAMYRKVFPQPRWTDVRDAQNALMTFGNNLDAFQRAIEAHPLKK